MKKVHAKPHFVDGIRNLRCCNVEPHGGCCDDKSHWQQGGGRATGHIYTAMHCIVECILTHQYQQESKATKEIFIF